MSGPRTFRSVPRPFRAVPLPAVPRTLLCVLALLFPLLLAGCSSDGADGGGPASPAATAPRSASDTPDASADSSGSVPAWAEGMETVREERLPPQARDTLDLIDAGGPFPYAKDGSVFGNFEGLLPERRRGYYREYTVPTPGSRDRGARRLVTGEGGEIYYTDDHYESFRAVLR